MNRIKIKKKSLILSFSRSLSLLTIATSALLSLLLENNKALALKWNVNIDTPTNLDLTVETIAGQVNQVAESGTYGQDPADDAFVKNWSGTVKFRQESSLADDFFFASALHEPPILFGEGEFKRTDWFPIDYWSKPKIIWSQSIKHTVKVPHPTTPGAFDQYTFTLNTQGDPKTLTGPHLIIPNFKADYESWSIRIEGEHRRAVKPVPFEFNEDLVVLFGLGVIGVGHWWRKRN